MGQTIKGNYNLSLGTRHMQNDYMDNDFDECVSNAHLASSGWGMDCFNHSNPFESHAFYVIDYRFSTVNLLTVSRSDFNRVTPPDQVTTGDLAGVRGRSDEAIPEGRFECK